MLPRIPEALYIGQRGEYLNRLANLWGGKWRETKQYASLINPLDGGDLLQYPNTQLDELEPFLESLATCPKYGRHNPLNNVERYLMLGKVSNQAAELLRNEEVADYFAKLIQSVMPKSYAQCIGEVNIVKEFLANFSPDRVRFLGGGTTNPGNHLGQQSQDYFWPFGPVVIISPFNFPLEIPALQLMGALYMGNKPLIKSATTVSVVIEEFIRLLHLCGLPMEDVDLIHCRGQVMRELLLRGKDIIRLTQFTGSSSVAEDLAVLLHGKIKIEDAGFDWKIFGLDYDPNIIDYVAWQCDQDAYAASGQKCSAQSILFVHKNWYQSRLDDKLAELAKERNLADLTIGPVLSWTTEKMLKHIQKLADIHGAKILFGGKALKGHGIPFRYGAIEPTAVFVPLKEMMKPEYFNLVTTEIFGPVQVITTYDNDTLGLVLEACEKMNNHLTAAVVSNDPVFINKILGATINGTTYVGYRARTTGAPQNHFFGPCGDPRAAAIGTPEAIRLTWSAPRCIIYDVGPIDPEAPLIQS